MSGYPSSASSYSQAGWGIVIRDEVCRTDNHKSKTDDIVTLVGWAHCQWLTLVSRLKLKGHRWMSGFASNVSGCIQQVGLGNMVIRIHFREGLKSHQKIVNMRPKPV